MRELLFLAHRIPYPPDKGDKTRAFHQLQHLARSFRVHLGAFVDDPGDWRHVPELQKLCAETHFARLDPRLARLRSLAGLARGEPLSLGYYRDAGLARWVRELLATRPIGHALAYSSPMSQYLRDARDRVRVADFVDVDSDKWRQYAATRAWPMSWVYAREARRLAQFERATAAAFDATLLVTAGECELMRGIAPEAAGRIHFVGSGVDDEYFSPAAAFANPYGHDEPVAVFTGTMDYWPNVDAVRWFASEVFPRVRAAQPRAHFCIVGARPTAAVRSLGALEGVTVTGAVPDVRPYLAHARVAVAPLRIARGVQTKVLEAMAMAKAVVASPEAAVAIEARAGEELVVAHGAEEFAAAVARLLVDESRHRIGAAARARVQETYAWRPHLERLESLITGLPRPAPLIAHVLYRFDVGGLENGICNLINSLPRGRYRHAVICITDYTDFALRIRRPDVSFHALRKPPGNNVAIHARLWRLFRDLRPAVVHTRNLAGLEAQAAAWLARVPARVHGEHGRDVGDYDGTSPRHRRIRRLFSPFVQRYVAVSRDLADYLVGAVGIDAGRVMVMPGGVDTGKFHPRPDGEPDGAARPFVVGTVGRMQAVKNPMLLARAFVRALEIEPGERDALRLEMVGDGALREEVIAFLSANGALDRAELPGARDDVDARLRAFDLFALPSLGEGTSNTLLEAMATGLPAVATRVGGNAELVVPGQTGVLVPSGDVEAMARAILHYRRHRDEARRHGAAARARAVELFSLEAQVKRYDELYAACLERSGRHAAPLPAL